MGTTDHKTHKPCKLATNQLSTATHGRHIRNRLDRNDDSKLWRGERVLEVGFGFLNGFAENGSPCLLAVVDTGNIPPHLECVFSQSWHRFTRDYRL
jgi:hypothetical protein